jgi:hypothetical protein
VKIEAHSLFEGNTHLCSNWAKVTEAFDQLPKPAFRLDDEGETYRRGWIYRGHKSELFRLVPTIERIHPFSEWAAMV